jgi:hypothetical protein
MDTARAGAQRSPVQTWALAVDRLDDGEKLSGAAGASIQKCLPAWTCR